MPELIPYERWERMRDEVQGVIDSRGKNIAVCARTLAELLSIYGEYYAYERINE